MRWYILFMILLYSCIGAVLYARSHPVPVDKDYAWASWQLKQQRAGYATEAP